MSTTPASVGDHTEPTFKELADLAEELAFPLDHSRVLLEMIRFEEVQEVKNQCSVAAAVIALIEQADRMRNRLMEHLDRLAQRTTEGSQIQDQP